LVASKLAEMALLTFVGESMGYRTTGLVDERLAGAKTDAEKIDAIEEFSVEASIIKVFGSEALNVCADEAVQIHGGYGFIEEFAVERLLRDSRINRIFEGTNEINRLIVPGTILKRAVKGQIPLMARAYEVREQLAKGAAPPPPAGDLSVEQQVAEMCKWIVLYVLSVAGEVYQLKVSEEQEILGDIADMIMRAYAIDTVLQRVRQLDAAGDQRRRTLGRDVLTAWLPRAYGHVIHTGRHILMDICDGATRDEHLRALDHLRMDWPSKVLTAKRRLAAAVLASDGYPF
jgi:hypothetical protein